MTQYSYRAVDSEGQDLSGTMEGSSTRHVAQILQERGLTVNEVRETYPKRGLLRVVQSLTWDDIEICCQHLHSIAKGGMPLGPPLKHLAEDLRNPRLKPVLERMHQDLENGVSLEEAVERQRGALPRVFPAILRAGEASGNLAGVLQLLVEYAARMVQLKNTLQTVMIYPMLLIFASALVLWFLMVKVVPVYAEIFRDFGTKLPAPTVFWVGVSDGLSAMGWEWVLVLGGAVAALYGVRRLLERTQTGRVWSDTILLHLPGIGRTYYLVSAGRFARTLSLLLTSRVPILNSLELAGSVSGSAQIERAAEEAAVGVAGGERLSDALGRTKLFGAHFRWLLSTGEDRGEAETALDSFADACQREVMLRDKMLGLFIAPALIVIMGILIGSIVISLYLPIFSLGDAIGMG